MVTSELRNYEWNIMETEAFQFMSRNPNFYKIKQELEKLQRNSVFLKLLEDEVEEKDLKELYLSKKEQRKILRYVHLKEKFGAISAEAYYRAGEKHCLHFLSNFR